MTGWETGDLLRIAMLGGFAGLVIFAGAYGVAVWLRRNKSRGSAKHYLLRVGITACVLGFVGCLASWAVGSFSRRAGVVDGNDLFVLHRMRDATVLTLAQQGPVKAGAILAEFKPLAMDGRLAVIDSQIKEASSRVDVLQVGVLLLDPVPLQRQAQLRTQAEQHRLFRFELQRSAREFERDQLALLLAWTREQAQIGADLASSKKSLETTGPQIALAKAALDRVTGLYQRQVGAMQPVDDRANAVLGLQLDQNRHQLAVLELEGRGKLLSARYEKSNSAFTEQLRALNGGIEKASTDIAATDAEYESGERLLELDRIRARLHADREIVAARFHVATLEAERSKVTEVTSVIAPFSGNVVYRHPSAGLAADNVSVLALATGSGFTARVLMSPQEAQSVAEDGEVKFALESPVVTRYFGGTFRKLDTTFEPNSTLAIFDVQLPLETITDLGAGREVKVRLMWEPRVYLSPGFQAGAALSFVGLVCMGLGLASASTRKPPPPVLQHPPRRLSVIHTEAA